MEGFRKISTEDRVPESQRLDECCNKYYPVRIRKVGVLRMAFYCNGEWFTSYCEKIFLPVDFWYEEITEENC